MDEKERRKADFTDRDVRGDSAEKDGREDLAERDKIVGRNALIEAMRAGREIDRILIAKGSEGLGRIYGMAREAGIPVKEVAPIKIEESAGGANAQGVLAFAAAHSYAELDDVFALAKERGEPPFIIVADGLEDAHNLGALIRTAECCGAHGVIIPRRRSVGLSYIVSKTSAGAIEYVPVVRVTNIARTLEELKERGVWIFCADMGGQPWCEADFSGPLALVVGAEGEGVGRLVKEKCDFTISLPMRGKIESLNASVAASVVMYEAARQRLGIKAR